MSDDTKEYDLSQQLTDEEFHRILSANNEEEWNAACDAVKKTRNGRYPDEWFMRMNASGLMAKIFASFREPDLPR